MFKSENFIFNANGKYNYMESSNKECQQQYVQIGINKKSFHFINVFTLKTYNKNNNIIYDTNWELRLMKNFHDGTSPDPQWK